MKIIYLSSCSDGEFKAILGLPPEYRENGTGAALYRGYVKAVEYLFFHGFLNSGFFCSVFIAFSDPLNNLVEQYSQDAENDNA